MLDRILSITAILQIAAQWFHATDICRVELVDRLGRHTRRCHFRRGDRPFFSARGMARRLLFLSASPPSARSHFVFRPGIYQHSFWSYRSRFGDGSGNRGGLDDCERNHHANLLFSRRLAHLVSNSFPFTGDQRHRGNRDVADELEGAMKIGFIAMSGLRLCDVELLNLGLTFPGVSRRKNAIEALPSLGLLTLAGMTPPHIAVEYLEVRDVNLGELPRDFDAVAISTLTATAGEAYRLAARFKSIGTKVILGGLHVSALPEESRRHADAIVIGEGESTWPRIVRDLEMGKLDTLYDGRLKPFDLAHSPVPRFELLAPDRYPRLTVQTQRGCPWRCEFCAASIRISPQFKVKPVDRVIAEIRRLKELWRDPFVEFADDNTFVNRAHSEQMMRALARENIRWFTETDLSIAQDPELLRLIREAGCAQVLIGFESPSRRVLHGVEQRSDWKARQWENYRAAVERIQRTGITVNGCFVIGLDGAGNEQFDEAFDFVRESGLYDVQITFLTPFPGTPLYERFRRSGRLLNERAWNRCTLFDINFQPAAMSVAELRSGFENLGRRLYHPDFVRERSRRFLQNFRAARAEERRAA